MKLHEASGALTLKDAIKKVADVVLEKKKDLHYGGSNDTRVDTGDYAETLEIIYGQSTKSIQKMIDHLVEKLWDDM